MTEYTLVSVLFMLRGVILTHKQSNIPICVTLKELLTPQ